MTARTFAPVRVVPQAVPAAPGGGAVWAEAEQEASSPPRLAVAARAAVAVTRRRIVITYSCLPVALYE